MEIKGISHNKSKFELKLVYSLMSNLSFKATPEKFMNLFASE